jgi:integrase
MTMHLTKQAIDAIVAKARDLGGKQLELVDDREPGLRIRAGARVTTWSLLARLPDGKRIRISLGTWPGMSIADARRAAQDQRREIDAGIDPNQKRRETILEAKTALTLNDVLDRYESERLIYNKRGAATRRAIDGKRGLLKAFSNKDVASITRDDIVDAVRAHAKQAPIAANRCLAYVSAFLNWCVEQGLLNASPAATVKKPSKERERDRYHSIEELREIWDAAGTMGYPFGPLYRLLIVLPMRREEVAAISLTEIKPAECINAQEAVWTLPSSRTKRANALRVSLSNLARSIISEALADPLRPEGSDYVFTTTGDTPVSGFSKAKIQLDAAITRARLAKCPNAGAMPHWVVHDLRTTFSTLACDILLADVAVVDRILNHVASATTSKVRRVYNRSEMFEPRKAALEQWADLVVRKVIS